MPKKKVLNLLKEATMREIHRMEKVFTGLKVINENPVLDMARRYFEDAKFFASKEKWLEAFEAVVISWAYIDALLHLGYVEIPEELSSLFTK